MRWPWLAALVLVACARSPVDDLDRGGRGSSRDTGQSLDAVVGVDTGLDGSVDTGFDTGVTSIDTGPGTCPANPPFNEVCSDRGLRCSYGQECCCGECFDSLVCQCGGGRWGCFATDACLGAHTRCPDAGTLDAGVDMRCRHAAGVPFTMSASMQGDLRGQATVRGTNPLHLTFAAGQEVDIHFSDPPFTLPDGDTFEVELHANRPWWSEVAVSFRRTGMIDDLVAAAWSHTGSRMRINLPELGPEYVDDMCDASRIQCGEAITRTLRVRGSGAIISIPSGTAGGAIFWEIKNADAYRYIRIDCTDTPNDWIAGTIVRR